MNLRLVRLKLAHKLALLGALLLIPLVVATFQLLASLGEGIEFAEQEVIGVEYHSELRGLLPELQIRRGAASAVLRGDAAFRAQLGEATASIERRIVALRELDGRLGARLQTTDRLKALLEHWDALKSLDATTADESFKAHSALVEELLGLMDHVSNTSNLALDPDVDSYYVITLATSQVPRLAEKIGRERAVGVAALLAGRFPQEARLELTQLSGMVLALREAAEHSVAMASDANAEVKARLSGPMLAATNAVAGFVTTVEQRLVRGERSDLQSGALFAAGTQAIESVFGLYDTAMPVARQLLQQRIDRLTQRKWGVLGLVLGSVAVALLVMVLWVRRGMLRPIRQAAAVAQAVARGELDNDIDVRGRDEVGDLMRALAQMQADLKARLERDRATAEEALRVKVALDNCTTNVRIADLEGRIVYANDALKATVQRLEPVLRQRNPGFRAERLVGESVGIFYDDPQSALARLAQLDRTTSTEMNIGGRDFRVFTTPIRDADGRIIGTVGEWVDRTEEKAAEREVGSVVEAAAAGDFTRQVPLEGKQGFHLQLARDVNRLVTLAEQGMSEVGRVLREMAQGDLTHRVEGELQGRFAQLQADTNQMGGRLQELIGQIRQSAEAINTAAKEIASGNADLSQRTEEQASSLQETASSMEELTSTVRQNAENARQANQLAIGASEVAVQGGNVVAEVVTTMNAIHDSARKIVDIISVIDGIAFQTNILALNAAVEAARAGEQGRGFAVVATEVRNLAQRSAAAAKEIKALISDSVEKVDAGTKLVDQAGATMQEVVGAVKRVTDIMAEITAASLEQSSGIEQVNQAITQMDEVTQQNAALVEQAAAAAESLEEQAQVLAQACAVFRLGQVLQNTPGAPGFVERRGPNRARNVARLPAREAAAGRPAAGAGTSAKVRASGAGAEDEWEEF